MTKFQVNRATDGNDQVQEGRGTESTEPVERPTFSLHVQDPDEVALSMNQDAHEEAKKNLFLYEEDMKQMPRVATFLKNITNYHTTHPSEKDVQRSKKQPKRAKLGIVLGVYLPTIQHIFGVLMFVRLAWIVGSMGTLEAFVMVFMCCLTTFVTAISMSAIATNGVVSAGGSYFMISRNLGPECGGAVGICFYLANTFAVDLYTLGAIEILLQYMAPGLSFFGDMHTNPWNNFRVYGTVVVILLTFVVAVGVKFVAIFAPFSLACVVVSILCVFIGSFVANVEHNQVWICVLGDRLMALPDNMTIYEGLGIASWCNKNDTGDLISRYCGHDPTNHSAGCDYMHANDPQILPGIPGFASGIIKENLFSKYMHAGEVSPGVIGDHHRGEVVQDISTTFVHLCAIYFPSVTGIMTGSNMSGDLRDPQKSIPIGTILATLTTSFVYLSFVVLFGATSSGYLLRDKFGESLGGSLLVAKLAWPNHWVILVGAFCSTIGAALQCLTSAPRLLQAIARDNIIPFLDVFKVTTKNGEPIRALILTALIAEIGILIASLDYVAPVIDVFFLMCYGFVNLACAVQTLMRSPSWRPRFKYYHWSLSFIGVFLNLTLSITAGWYYALGAFAIAAFIYKYVEYKGGEKEWGDGITGLSMSAAQRALLKLDEGDPHTKNWRPQILVLCKLQQNYQPTYRRLFSFVSQLKAGKGLTVFASVIHGDYLEIARQAEEAKQEMTAIEEDICTHIKDTLKEEKVKGFAKVMITKDVTEGLNIFVQTVGLGGMRHNTVLVGWPYGWNRTHEEKSWKVFLDTVRAVQSRELALLVPRGIENFPSNKEKQTGVIDVWWIVHDGGMLILLSFLLKQHKVWRNCKIRLFTVAQMADNTIQLRKDLEDFLYQLRIDAEVHVEEMYDNDISAYTVERTLDMEKRASMLRELHLHKRRPTIQEVLDAAHTLVPPESGNSTPGFAQSSAETSVDGIVGEDSHLSPRNQSASGLMVPADEANVQFTFSAADGRAFKAKGGAESTKEGLKIAEGKLMRMHTAVKLNASIREKSGDSALVILNFPAPPAKLHAEENYMEYLEALTEGLDRVLMARGSGREVVTIYS